MFLHKKKKEKLRREAEEKARRWMGTFSHPDVEVDPDNRSTENSKFVRILSDPGAAAFFTAFMEPHNCAGVQELTVLGDNPLKGVTSSVTTAGCQLIGSAIASLPTITLFKFSNFKLDYDKLMALCFPLGESRSLQTVILWKCRIDDFMASHAVEHLLQIPTIRVINLGQNLLTADGKTYLENNAKAINPYIDLRMF